VFSPFARRDDRLVPASIEPSKNNGSSDESKPPSNILLPQDVLKKLSVSTQPPSYPAKPS
jgi:hypothetical protein